MGVDFSTFPYNSASIFATYVQLPVFAKYKISILKDKFDLSAKLGAGSAYATSAYMQSNNTVSDNKSDITPIHFNNDDGFTRTDGGLYGGLGFAYKIGPGMILFETEAYRGLKSMHNHFNYFPCGFGTIRETIVPVA